MGWGTLAGYCGYPQQPAYYDYGGNVVSQPDAMYVNGDPAGTPQQYAQQASQLAASECFTWPLPDGPVEASLLMQHIVCWETRARRAA